MNCTSNLMGAYSTRNDLRESPSLILYAKDRPNICDRFFKILAFSCR